MMGNHEVMKHIMKSEDFFGVDYAPPTPAPAKEHIIGEEDEEDQSQKHPVRRPPPFPGSKRPHPAHAHLMLKPPSQPAPKSSQQRSSSSSMAPPQSLPVKPVKLPSSSSAQAQRHKHQQQHQQQSSHPKLSPLKMPSGEKKPVKAPTNEVSQ